MGGSNPDLLALRLGTFLRRSFAAGDGSLSEGRYVELGGQLALNPAYAQASLQLEFVPLAPLRLRLSYDVFAYQGRAGALLSFADPGASFGRRARDALDGEEVRAWGQRVLLQPTLRLRLGPLLLINETDLAAYLLPEGPYVLEQEYDTLLESDFDLLLANRARALYELWDGPGEATLLCGPQYEVVHARSASLTRQRVGGLLYFVPCERLGRLRRPRLYVWGGATLQDPSRAGEGFVVVGIGFDLSP